MMEPPRPKIFMIRAASRKVLMNEALHGEQEFEYGGAICAGDLLTGRQHIADLREKKHGTMLFLVTKFQVANQLGEHVLDMTQTSIVPLSRLEG